MVYAIIIFCILMMLWESIMVVLLIYARIALKKRKKTGKKIFFRVAFIVLLLIFTLFIVSCTIEERPGDDSNSEQGEDSKSNNYERLISNVVFQKTLVNAKETDWEFMINKGFGFSEYITKSEAESSPCELRTRYFNEYADALWHQKVDEEQLSKMIQKYSGTDILPTTDRSLAEVTADIFPAENRINTPPDVFKEETILRVQICETNPSGNNFYQAGRAADDVVKTLIERNECTIKELLFYSYLAVSYYLLCMDYVDREVSDSKVYYNLSIIFVYLYEYGDYESGCDYNKHFLLSADAYMRMAKQKYAEETIENVNINAVLPECDYYSAAMLNNFIALFNCDNKEIWKACVENAKNYNDYAGEGDRHYEECSQYIRNYSEY